MTVTTSEHKPAPPTTQRQGTPMPHDPTAVLNRDALAARFRSERLRLGFGNGYQLSKAIGCSHTQVSRTETGETTPGGELLARFADAGADINYILTGEHRISPVAVHALLGKAAAHLSPEQLLGAILCIANASADYTADLNPYPPKSPHHAGVETGWRMARAVITGDTTELPGVL
jgi:transcriptional regulator with XRE-family HTH domain